jgi:hypothetical protein
MVGLVTYHHACVNVPEPHMFVYLCSWVDYLFSSSTTTTHLNMVLMSYYISHSTALNYNSLPKETPPLVKILEEPVG